MAKSRRAGSSLPKGVTELARDRGGRKYRAAIRNKGVEVHLGLYESVWHAAFAFNVAWTEIGRGVNPPNDMPLKEGPSSDEVREITGRVRRRLGLDRARQVVGHSPPSLEALLTFFEITVLGFWRGEVVRDPGEDSLRSAAIRVYEASRLLLWEIRPGWPTSDSALQDQLIRRLNTAFRRPEVTREILEDDGDDPIRLARWLVLPDESSSIRGFREEVRHLYADLFREETASPSGWAEVLGLTSPVTSRKVREAYRRRSKSLHPDAGGSDVEFVRLKAAYEQALTYLRHHSED